jgi:glycyl-tRNA synthetase beta chain
MFILDRAEGELRELSASYDIVRAVRFRYLTIGKVTEDPKPDWFEETRLLRLRVRTVALQAFLKTENGANLLTAYRRAANILKAEEKKDKTTFDGAPDAALLKLPQEKALAEALAGAETSIAADVAAEKFVEAMGVMAKLRGPVDAFFDKVKVNDDDPAVRRNRLMLLARLRATLHLVADFSKIEG